MGTIPVQPVHLQWVQYQLGWSICNGTNTSQAGPYAMGTIPVRPDHLQWGQYMSSLSICNGANTSSACSSTMGTIPVRPFHLQWGQYRSSWSVKIWPVSLQRVYYWPASPSDMGFCKTSASPLGTGVRPRSGGPLGKGYCQAGWPICNGDKSLKGVTHDLVGFELGLYFV